MSPRASNVPLPEAHLLALAVGAGLDRVHRWRLPRSRVVSWLTGGPLVVAGAWLALRSVAAAGQTRLEVPDRLVTRGPYAVCRNPMYVASAMLHLGIGVAARSGWSVALLPIAVLWTHRQVLAEEAHLRRAFPEAFAAYRAAVPRYVANVGPRCRGLMETRRPPTVIRRSW